MLLIILSFSDEKKKFFMSQFNTEKTKTVNLKPILFKLININL
jgi:hypothetical protein